MQFSTEAMKLAALGVTIVVSSGDNGAAGRVQNCNANSGSVVAPLWVVSVLFALVIRMFMLGLVVFAGLE